MRMKNITAKTICLVLPLLIILFGSIGCQKHVPDQTRQTRESAKEDSVSSGSLIDLASLNYRLFCWDEYESAETLVNAATNVFEGKVVNISFEILNLKTGEIDRNSESDADDRLLYTLYLVEVLDDYKGTSTSLITIKMEGGINSSLEEQEALCQEAGVVRPIIIGGTKELSIGKTYLFCTHRFQSYDAIINMKQFAYPTDSAEAEAIRQACAVLN